MLIGRFMTCLNFRGLVTLPYSYCLNRNALLISSSVPSKLKQILTDALTIKTSIHLVPMISLKWKCYQTFFCLAKFTFHFFLKKEIWRSVKFVRDFAWRKWLFHGVRFYTHWFSIGLCWLMFPTSLWHWVDTRTIMANYKQTPLEMLLYRFSVD